MQTVISTKGQIVLPADLRSQDGIEPGHVFSIERIDKGQYRLTLQRARPNHGVVDWLLACPDKGYFEPIPSESTDVL